MPYSIMKKKGKLTKNNLRELRVVFTIVFWQSFPNIYYNCLISIGSLLRVLKCVKCEDIQYNLISSYHYDYLWFGLVEVFLLRATRPPMMDSTVSVLDATL